jgi:hypothetical protein
MADRPIACTLNASDLQHRLAEIAQVGADGLSSQSVQDGRHVLRFRADDATHERLNAIVAAEADCCSSLDLALTEDGDELVLTIAAPSDARPLADDLARAFAGPAA